MSKFLGQGKFYHVIFTDSDFARPLVLLFVCLFCVHSVQHLNFPFWEASVYIFLMQPLEEVGDTKPLLFLKRHKGLTRN